MSESEKSTGFIKRARFVAGLSAVAAAILLVLTAISAGAGAMTVLKLGRLVTPHGMVISLLKEITGSGVAGAVRILGIGILVLVAVQMACSKEKPWWSRGQDAAFLRRALLFAKGVEIFAWVCLVHGVIAWVGSLSEWTRGFFSEQQEALYRGTGVTRLVSMIATGLSSQIEYFIMLLLGAYLIRAMVLLSAADAKPGVSESTGEVPSA